MGRQDEIVKERLKKIAELRKNGINPYAHKSEATHTTAELQEKYKSLKNEAAKKDSVVVHGRLLGFRDMGKIAFGTLDDGYGKIQIVMQDESTPKKVMEFASKYVDAGDFIEAEGTILRTKRGELSVAVKGMKMLTKSIYPLPEKWHGIQDEEERYRKRYLDIAMNPEVRKMFERKSKFWQTMRQFLLDKGFMEVETPILESVTGGAEARPFITHHNALDIDMYLRISPELWLKRMMVAGYPKVFEIGRIFRNEGMDAEHLQDYTQMEFYWAYADYNDSMKMVEEMYKHIAKETFGTLKFKIKDFDVDLGKKWEIYDFSSTIKKMTGIDVLDTSLEEVESKLKSLDVDYDRHGFNLNRGIDTLWKFCRRKIAGPGFLVNVPVFMEPLAKRMESKPDLVERYQIILAGSELGKGFTELNDPIDQLGRFEDQQKLREQGDDEAQMKDDDFVEALKYAMPPTTGFGISERLFSFLEGKPIRETVIFPTMRPEKKQTIASKNENKSAPAHHTVVASDNEALKIARADSLALLKKYVKSESLVNHCLAVEASVRAYAVKYGANVDAWGTAGLLHDFDYEEFPEKHPLPGVEILKSKQYPDFITQAILAHAPERTNVSRQTLLDKVLFAVDELSGFIVALSKVRPNGFEGMTAESVEKALKKKDFAKNVSRTDIEQGIIELGVDRKEHFEMVIKALSQIFPKK